MKTSAVRLLIVAIFIAACSSDDLPTAPVGAQPSAGGASSTQASTGGSGGAPGTGGAPGAGGTPGAGGAPGAGGIGGAGGAQPDWVTACANTSFPVEVVGSGHYATVAAAVFAAPAGATVRVCPGIYIEPSITIERDLTLIGAGMGQTILQSDGNDDTFLSVEHASFTLEDVTVEKAQTALELYSNEPRVLTFRRVTFTQSTATAVYIGGPSDAGDVTTVELTDVTMTHNEGVLAGALYLARRVGATLTGCTLEHNSATSRGGAMRLAPGSEATVIDSTIRMNTAPEGGGTYIGRSQYDGAGALEIINSDWGAGQALDNAADDVFCEGLKFIVGPVSVGWLGAAASTECHGGITTCCQ